MSHAAKNFSDLHAAICELPHLDTVRDELLNLWNNLEEEASADVALSKFDCYVCDLSAEAQAFYLAWIRA